MSWFIVKNSDGFDAVDLSKCTAITMDEKAGKEGFAKAIFYDIREGSVLIPLKPHHISELLKRLEG